MCIQCSRFPVVCELKHVYKMAVAARIYSISVHFFFFYFSLELCRADVSVCLHFQLLFCEAFFPLMFFLWNSVNKVSSSQCTQKNTKKRKFPPTTMTNTEKCITYNMAKRKRIVSVVQLHSFFLFDFTSILFMPIDLTFLILHIQSCLS